MTTDTRFQGLSTEDKLALACQLTDTLFDAEGLADMVELYEEHNINDNDVLGWVVWYSKVM